MYTNRVRCKRYILQLQISYNLCARNYESWLRVDKVIATIKQVYFLAHHVY